MPDWQERITRQTHPAARVEHALRYAALGPLLSGTAGWADLGAGRGFAVAGVPRFEGRLVLVDSGAEALKRAAGAADAREVREVVADLSRREDIARVGDALRDAPQGPRLVTCFGVIERLVAFGPLLEALVAGAGEGATVVLSVPNDSLAPPEAGARGSVWTPGAFEELRRLLPDDARLANQVSLTGSCLLPVGDGGPAPASLETIVKAGELGAPPTHLVVAFGPRAGELALPAARVVEADRAEEQRWASQRESDLAYFQAANRELEEEVRRLRDRLVAAGQPVDEPAAGSVVRLHGPEGPARPA
jgi:hypothetical protein